jgi:uncharacterized protein YqgC (DUF456 family)
MLVGLAGVILPVLPGIPLVWLGLFIYAIFTGFDSISVTAVVVFFIIMLLTLVLDFLAPILGAKKYKATKVGMLGAFLGLMIGLFTLGFWGVILGPFLGALLGELIASRKPVTALKAALGTFIGFVFGTLLRLVVGLTMIGFFIASFV